MSEHSSWITCADGYTLGVLAGPLTRCRPRLAPSTATRSGPNVVFDVPSWPGRYTHVEVMIVGGVQPPGWEQYDSDDEGFYGFVPVGLVQQLIDAHGGES